MNLQAEKIKLAKRILSINSPKVIESIRLLLKEEESVDFWDDLTLEQQNEIKDAISEIEQGKSTDYETLMAKHR